MEFKMTGNSAPSMSILAREDCLAVIFSRVVV